MMHVSSWGIAGSVVDAGRPGRAWLGASRGGAVDLVSLALGNRLVGNAEHLGSFETSGGLTFTTHSAVMIAVVGAVARTEVTGGPPVGWGSPVVMPAGATVRVSQLLDGARTYVAVRGGVGVDAAGAVDDAGAVAVGPDPGSPAAEHAAPRRPPRTQLRVWPGPRLDWFVPDAFERLCSAPFEVTATSRVGTRLSGTALHRTRPDELPSEGMIEGAIQVPPDGNPIVFLADHPTTGGYPVIAVVDPDDVAHLAQAAPGTRLTFRPSRRT